MYKSLNSQLPLQFTNISLTKADIHNYNTRIGCNFIASYNIIFNNIIITNIIIIIIIWIIYEDHSIT